MHYAWLLYKLPQHATVFVSAPVNVALGKPAFQSTIRFKRGPSLAVDGNLDPNSESGGSCSATNSNPRSWWAVDLGAVVKVKEVALQQRNAHGNSCNCFILVR